MYLFIARVLHKSGSPVTACYDNKHFEVHFVEEDTKQSSLNILSLAVLLSVGDVWESEAQRVWLSSYTV